MSLRALDDNETVNVPDTATESAEFQIPDWASSVGALVPDDVGKSTIILQAATASAGDFINVVHFGVIRKAPGNSGYFDLSAHMLGTSPGWYFRFKFNKAQTGPYDIVISFRGA